MSKHLIFFDSACSLCQRSVQRIQRADTHKIFSFYPLNSEKAKELLPEELRKGDTLVLLEEGKKKWVRASAVFRILGLLGSKWGVLAYVPGLDLFYRLVAHNRYLFK